MWNAGPVHFVFAPSLVRGSVVVRSGRTAAQEISCSYQLSVWRPTRRWWVSRPAPACPRRRASRWTRLSARPFVTSRADQGGLGLGLSIVEEIARRHGGAVELHSEPGRGTRVEILLPAL